MPLLRRFIESATHGVTFTRRLPKAFGGGRIVVSTDGGLRYLFRRMENIDPLLHEWVRCYVNPGNVVWDAGANVGLFTFAAAHCAGVDGRVIALEPDSTLAGMLRRSAALQPRTSAPVDIVPVAVGREIELRTFNIAKRARSSNYLDGYGTIYTGDVSERHTVPTVTLDWLATQMPLPQVLKIDVEGAELELLRGAKDVLSQARPVVICEVFGEHSAEVADILRALNYKVYDGSLPRAQRQPLDLAPYHTIALPSGLQAI